MLFHDAFKFGRNFFNGLVPGNFFKLVPDLFQRMSESVGVVLIVLDVQPLAADIAFAARIVLVPLDFSYTVVLYADFQSAYVASQYTGCFFPIGHINLLLKKNNKIIEMLPKMLQPVKMRRGFRSSYHGFNLSAAVHFRKKYSIYSLTISSINSLTVGTFETKPETSPAGNTPAPMSPSSQDPSTASFVKTLSVFSVP